MAISDVLAQYDRIRAKNEQEAQRRRQEVYTRLPQLRALHTQKTQLQLQRITQELSGGDFSDDDILALREQANSLLVGAGYDPGYLDPIFDCPVCRDTGVKDDAQHCECFKRRVLEDKLAAAKLLDHGASFELFDIDVFDDTPGPSGRSQKETMGKIRTLAEQYADTFPLCDPFLVLSGPTGLGKTYLSKCIQRRVLERGHTAAYYTAYRLFSMFHQDRLGEPIDLSAIFEVPLLIIDDVGTEPMTRNVTVEYFFDLINERSGAGHHTIVITNLALHEIKDRYGGPIHSRLMDKYTSKIVIFSGRDIRY